MENDKESDNELQNIHSNAKADFDNIQSALRDERLQCLKDRRFYSIAGAQWEGKLGEQFENKPKFEVNKIHLAVIRIINEYRNNRITVDFISKDGSDTGNLADACDDLYRADEQDSVAEEAYDNAFEEAVGGGFGAWRLRTEVEDEEDEDNDHQRIRIEPIFDADSSVFFDLNAKRQDKKDAKRCYVLTSMTLEAYKDEYGDDPASWSKEIEQTEFDWLTPDVVYVAEYYVIEETFEMIHVYQDLQGEEERYLASEFVKDDDLKERLEAIGKTEIRTRNVKRKKVHKYIMSGSKILEDCGFIAGKNIPIISVYGKRWFVDNVERCMGHVRLAKDPQQLKNMQLSKLGEISALSSVQKPIFTPEQMAGHAVMWSEDNLKDYPYLLVNPITDAGGQAISTGPIGYTKPPDIPPAMAALLQLTETDMQDILGNQQGGDKIVSNISGEAVDMIQQRLDMQTFIYMSNFAKGMRRCGEVWLSMAKDVYVEAGRKMKGVGSQDEVRSIELMRPVMGEADKVGADNDISSAKFDVAVNVGPSSTSRKAATVKSLLGMMQITQDPETQQVLQSMAMMNMEGEGISDVRDFFRMKLLRMGVIKPTEEEGEQLEKEAANAPPNAQEEYFKSAGEEAEANAASARADTVETIANASQIQAKEENIQADTVKKLAEADKIGTENVAATAKIIEGLQQEVTAQPSQMSENEDL